MTMTRNMMIMVEMKSCVASSFGFVESFISSTSVCSCSSGREACVSRNKFSHDSRVGWEHRIQNTLKYVWQIFGSSVSARTDMLLSSFASLDIHSIHKGCQLSGILGACLAIEWRQPLWQTGYPPSAQVAVYFSSELTRTTAYLQEHHFGNKKESWYHDSVCILNSKEETNFSGF
jgi:hypothetical protein